MLGIPLFRRLAAAYALNELASQVAAVALVTLVYRRTGSGLGAAAVFLATMIVPAAVSPALVARLARPGRSGILGWLYCVEAVLYGLLALAAAQHLAVAGILALALVDGVLALAARSLARAATARIAGERGLLREAGALNNFSFSVCYVVGPGVGGVLILLGGAVLALFGVAAAFAAITLVLLRAAVSPPPAEPSRGGALEAIAHVWRVPSLRRMFLLRGGGLVLLAISIPVEVVLAQRTLHAGQSGYPTLLSAWGAGTVLGALAYARASRLPSWTVLCAGAALMSAGFATMGLAGGIVVAAAGSVVAGTGNCVDAAAGRTLVQETVEPERMTLVLALYESVWTAFPAAGILLGGVLAQAAGPRAALLVGSAGAFALLVLTALLIRPGESGQIYDQGTVAKA